jgi:DNA-binding transcriptional LysR family regulator
MEWGDLRIFLAVARTGSLSAAGRALGLSQPTVGRRIQALEASLGTVLFQGRLDGYYLLGPGAALLPHAERMEEAARAAAGAGEAGEIVQTVRIAAGGWMSRFLAGIASELVAGLPSVTVEIFNSYGLADLTRREADLALRNRRPATGSLAIRRLGAPAYAVYASRGYAAAHPEAFGESRYGSCRWVGFDEAGASLPTARWLRERRRRPVELRCSQAVNILDAVRAGFGLGILPRFVGDAEAELLRVSASLDLESEGLWLVMHEDVRRQAHIRAAADRLVGLFEARKSLLSPMEPG